MSFRFSLFLGALLTAALGLGEMAFAETVVIQGPEALFITRQLADAGIHPNPFGKYIAEQVVCQKGIVAYNYVEKEMFKSLSQDASRKEASDFACFLNGEQNPLEAFVNDSENSGFARMKDYSKGELPMVIGNSLSKVAVSRVACISWVRPASTHAIVLEVDSRPEATCTLEVGATLSY